MLHNKPQIIYTVNDVGVPTAIDTHLIVDAGTIKTVVGFLLITVVVLTTVNIIASVDVVNYVL